MYTFSWKLVEYFVWAMYMPEMLMTDRDGTIERFKAGTTWDLKLQLPLHNVCVLSCRYCSRVHSPQCECVDCSLILKDVNPAFGIYSIKNAVVASVLMVLKLFA